MRPLRYFLSALCLIGVTAISPAAQAESYVAGYAGSFDVFDDDDAAQLGVEYRGEPWDFGVRPTVGINATSDSAVYAYAGIHWDVPIYGDSIYLTPNFAAGLYHEGAGKDLGHAIEFRSGIELGYQFENRHRLGIALNHVSNAGLGSDNPGAETLLINYQIPTSQLVK